MTAYVIIGKNFIHQKLLCGLEMHDDLFWKSCLEDPAVYEIILRDFLFLNGFLIPLIHELNYLYYSWHSISFEISQINIMI